MLNGLHIENLTKIVRGRVVLDGLTLHLAEGSFFMLLGENGAGKTTFFRCLLGLAKFSGAVHFVGAGKRKTALRADFAPVLDQSSLFASWSVRANINYHLNASRGHRAPAVQQLLSTPLLHQKAGRLSLGQRKIVMMAIALASEAPVLLLDEFANGLDFAHRQQMRAALATATASGKIIVATGHDLDVFDGLPTHVGKLNAGKITDMTAAYRQHGELKKIYGYAPE